MARPELFDSLRHPIVTITDRKIKFNTECVRKFGANNQVELLINPITQKLAVRAAAKTNRNALPFSKVSGGIYYPKDIPATAFYEMLFTMFQWNMDCKYKIIGTLYEKENELAYSRSFITRLCSVTEGLDSGATYRMSGEVIPSQKLAAFSLKTLRCISRGDLS